MLQLTTTKVVIYTGLSGRGHGLIGTRAHLYLNNLAGQEVVK